MIELSIFMHILNKWYFPLFLENGILCFMTSNGPFYILSCVFVTRTSRKEKCSLGTRLMLAVFTAELQQWFFFICQFMLEGIASKPHALVSCCDEEERILIVSFLPKSLSWVLWTSAAGIDRDAM